MGNDRRAEWKDPITGQVVSMGDTWRAVSQRAKLAVEVAGFSVKRSGSKSITKIVCRNLVNGQVVEINGPVFVRRFLRERMQKIERCSCPESLHLRAALRKIERIATEVTDRPMADDLAQIANLASQGLDLKPLVGDPGIGPVPE